jgi:hypothetical protein
VIQSKVVSLKPERQKLEPMPAIVNTIRQHSRRQLLSLLNKLLDCTDDALFEMADKSQNNIDHHLYFDSMRQIRLHRADIQKQFLDQINEAFEDIFASCGAAPGAEDPGATEIQMLDNDDLEISVAISGIVSKITSQFSLPIMELTKRLDYLAKHTSVRERRNPLGPQRLSEGFAAAIACLEVDIRIRIILLKLFERTVMQQMGPVYDEANRMLADAGVLKDLKRSMSRGRNPDAGHGSPRPQHSVTPGGTGTTAAAILGAGARTADPHAGAPERGGWRAGGDGGTGFSTIQSLLAHTRGPADAAVGDLGAVIATPALLNVLNAVQAESGRDGVRMDQVPPLVDLRQVLVSRAPDVTGEALNKLGRADEDVVNFIGLLFDYILNDRNLAIPMKALIARLQIPIVKLAIIDKSFFERSSHPARELLNELSSAGIGWSSAAELKRDAVYDKIESVVVRVLNGFSDNPAYSQNCSRNCGPSAPGTRSGTAAWSSGCGRWKAAARAPWPPSRRPSRSSTRKLAACACPATWRAFYRRSGAGRWSSSASAKDPTRPAGVPWSALWTISSGACSPWTTCSTSSSAQPCATICSTASKTA